MTRSSPVDRDPVAAPARGLPSSAAHAAVGLVRQLRVGLAAVLVSAVAGAQQEVDPADVLDGPLLREEHPAAARRLATPAAAPAVVATAPDADDAPVFGEDPLDAEVRVRMLTVSGGAVLRVSSRWADDHWEIETPGGWTALPAGSVSGARLEHRVVRERRERLAAIPRDAGPDAWLDLARWSLDVGLHEEALADLDRVLDRAPDHTEALRLLATPDLPIRLPVTGGDDAFGRAALVEYGGRAPRALQELVVRELGRTRDREGLRADLAARLRSPRSGERAFAALACRRLFPEGVNLEELLRRTLVDPYEEVRTSAALALRDTGEEGLTVPLVRALESGSSVLRTHAARGLGTMGFAAAVEPLALRLATLRAAGGGDGWRAPRSHIFVGRQVAFVQDFEPEVATSAVIANPNIGVAMEGATLDVGVQGIGGHGGGASNALVYSYTTETKALRHALATITGAEVRDTNTAWKEWWESHGRDWVARHHPVSAGGTTAGEG